MLYGNGDNVKSAVNLTCLFYSGPNGKKKTLKHPNASNPFPNIVICQRHSVERKGKARDIYTSLTQFKTNVNFVFKV